MWLVVQSSMDPACSSQIGLVFTSSEAVELIKEAAMLDRLCGHPGCEV
tara:strand:- start:1627 stop:1770 length:144 start_codon:yes stop_codon:yes gene_type:complete